MICVLYLTGEHGLQSTKRTSMISIISQGHELVNAIYYPLPVHKGRGSGFSILQRIIGFVTSISLRTKKISK